MIIRTMYIVTLIYFLLGFAGLYYINRKKEPQVARKSRIKTITYFIIVNIVFFSMAINAVFFRYLAVIIIIAGFLELFKLFRESGYQMKLLYFTSTAVFSLFSFFFFTFSGLEKELMLFVFMILCIFDSFSQITGQIFGKTKISKISPDKTLEGFIGGAIVALLSAVLIRGLTGEPVLRAVMRAAGVVIFAFAGDMCKSYYKRKYRVKDFSTLLPGNGGFLDRFDSLIAAGAWTAFLV